MLMDEKSASPVPDYFLLSRQPVRMPDFGPIYKETPSDPFAANARFPAEPWNTVTASFFILIAMYWFWRLKGEYRHYPFIVSCLPILLAGGIGGTLYHAFRTRTAYFLLDVIPISVLGIAGSLYLTIKLSRSMGRLRVMATAFGLFVFYFFLNWGIRLIPNPPANLPVNLSYASLAIVLLTPASVVLVKTQFRHVGWVIVALVCFCFGWFFRLVDNTSLIDWPMGTHWLWHTYGAATTLFLTEYFYRLERDDALARSPLPSIPSSNRDSGKSTIHDDILPRDKR
jgi:hypothetical protein